MEQENLRPCDLIAFLGSRSRVSEVLNGRRPLTLKMIRRLRDGLGIPADILLGEGKRCVGLNASPGVCELRPC